jgi:hypothetical protein
MAAPIGRLTAGPLAGWIRLLSIPLLNPLLNAFGAGR